MFDTPSLDILKKAIHTMEEGFGNLPEFECPVDMRAVAGVIEEVAERMHDNYPYFHPLYAGQMLKPPHPVARIAYMLAMYMNPNNHALDGGPASSRMEKEAVGAIATMLGWDTHLGDLSSGGTMANLEALWVAGQLHPGKKVLASEMAHYTHQRITGVLKIPYKSVPCTPDGRMNMGSLENILQRGETGTVVATLGTTGTGSLDPLDEIISLCGKYNCRVHVDAAYGGYFILASNLYERERSIFHQVMMADSLVIDPHKHGLQPYGCGCVLFRDPAVGRLYAHDSPYTYFTSDELHLGEISLECSRAGASAVALWATQKLLPMKPGGEFAGMLENCRNAALRLHEKMKADERFIVLMPPQLDILVWGARGDSITGISRRSQDIFNLAAEKNLHLALFAYPTGLLDGDWKDIEKDADTVTLVRMCLMKPEHDDYLDVLWDIIIQCIDETG